MVKPMSLMEQLRNDAFYPTKKIQVCFIQCKYDALFKERRKKVVQAMHDLLCCSKIQEKDHICDENCEFVNQPMVDYEIFSEAMERFAVTDYKFVLIDDNTTSVQFDDTFKKLKKLIVDLCAQGERPLVVYCFACHGM